MYIKSFFSAQLSKNCAKVRHFSHCTKYSAQNIQLCAEKNSNKEKKGGSRNATPLSAYTKNTY